VAETAGIGRAPPERLANGGGHLGLRKLVADILRIGSRTRQRQRKKESA